MSKKIERDAREIEVQLQAIRRKLRERLESEYDRGGLTAPQRLVMSEILRYEGLSLKDLSGQISLSHSTVSAIVTRLVERGLLERRNQEPDRRLSRLFVTEAVRTFLEKKKPELTLSPLVRALSSATTKDRNTIREGLDTLERLLS